MKAKMQRNDDDIRKVNGANILEIITILNKNFAKWVVIAFVIATPVPGMPWINGLNILPAKQISAGGFLHLPVLLALGIALLMVSFQSWKAATKNPVESLRYE